MFVSSSFARTRISIIIKTLPYPWDYTVTLPLEFKLKTADFLSNKERFFTNCGFTYWNTTRFNYKTYC